MMANLLKMAVLGALTVGAAGVTLVLGGSYLEHRHLVEAERSAHPAPGVQVSVGPSPEANRGLVHVFAEGEGVPTLVFLSGHGTASPFYDFLPLLGRLSDNFRVAVVERAGYGWSDISDRPRDLETVLQETRTALARAGESPPYVLFPHSLAGLETALWANRHPDEIEAVVGLDPLVPGYLERTGDGATLSPVITFLARSGLMRSGPDVFAENFPAMIEGRLSEEEAAAAEAIFMRRTNTPDMWAEARALAANAALARVEGPPAVPFNAFVSDTQPEAWIEAVTNYAETTGGDVVLIDAGHYLHVEKPGRIAELSREFLRRPDAE